MKRLMDRGLRGTLLRYQIMANIVGVLIIPVFIFFGLQLAGVGGTKGAGAVFGIAHGYLYIVYVITAGLLVLKVWPRLGVGWIVLLGFAGLIPGLTFVVEWLVVTKKVEPLLAEQDAVTTEVATPGSP